MPTLFVSDLDGTLLNKEDSLSEKTIETIHKLQEDGMCFTYATARSFSSAGKVAAGLVPSVPVVLYNGATILDAATGKVLKQTGFSLEESEVLQRVFTRFNLCPLVYAYVAGEEKVSYIASDCNEGMEYYLEKRRGDKRLRPVDDTPELYEGEHFYYACIGEKEMLAPVYEVLREDERFRVTFQQEIYRPEYWLEIMPATVSKANAILFLKELYGFDRIVSFGDSVNDIPMFEISDACYAVSNGADVLKELATEVIESNDADGVANWLSYHWQEQRMLSGMLYDVGDKLLADRRRLAHRLSKDYNDTYEEQEERREAILKELLPNSSLHIYLQGPIQFDYGTYTIFGSGCYANFNLTILDEGPVRIGKNVFFGPNCTLATPMHPLVADERWFRTRSNGEIYDWETSRPITVGDGCWIASNVTICGGVTIGENTVIGAGSVVTKDIPAGVLAAGNPCRVIREITEDDRILPESIRWKDIV